MRRSLVVSLTVIALMAVALPARACSCAPGDPRERLAAVDGAFIGTLLSKQPHADDPWRSTYTFSVDEEVKGELGSTVDVEGNTDGASCGLEVPIGEQTGLFLTLQDGEWWSGLCDQIAPDDLRDAAGPMPEPDGEGPIKMLVSGSWGDVGIVALDAEGRTLAYGERASDSGMLDVCPSSERFVEIYGAWNKPKLAIRHTSTMEIDWETPLPLMRKPYRWMQVGGLDCRDSAGGEILVAGIFDNGSKIDSVLLRVTSSGAEEVYDGSFGTITFDGRKAWITDGKHGTRLRRLNLRKMKARTVASVPDRSWSIQPSPDGKRLAMVTGSRPRLVVVDLNEPRDERVRSKSIGANDYGRLHWYGDDTLVFFPGGGDTAKVRLYSPTLKQQQVLDGSWWTSSNFVDGDTAYGFGWGVIYRAQLPDGPAEVLREFPLSELWHMTAVPDEIFATN